MNVSSLDKVLMYDAFKVKGNFSKAFKPNKFSDNAPGALIKNTRIADHQTEVSYKISIGLVSFILDGTVDISPNRYAVELPDCTPLLTTSHQNTVTLSKTTGVFITIKFSEEEAFLKWHKSIRTIIAEHIFETAFEPGSMNEVQPEKLEYAIMTSGPIIEEDHNLVVRAKMLWMTKLQLCDLRDRFHAAPQTVRKEELRGLFQQLMDETADPLLIGDPDAVLVASVATKVLSKKELAQYCKRQRSSTVDSTSESETEESTIMRRGSNGAFSMHSRLQSPIISSPEGSEPAMIHMLASADGITPLLNHVNDENIDTRNYQNQIAVSPIIATGGGAMLKPVSKSTSLVHTKTNSVEMADLDSDFQQLQQLQGAAVRSPKARDRRVPLVASPAAVSIVRTTQGQYMAGTDNRVSSDGVEFEIQQAEAVQPDEAFLSSDGVSSVTVAEIVPQIEKTEADLQFDDSAITSSLTPLSSPTPTSTSQSAAPIMSIIAINEIRPSGTVGIIKVTLVLISAVLLFAAARTLFQYSNVTITSSLASLPSSLAAPSLDGFSTAPLLGLLEERRSDNAFLSTDGSTRTSIDEIHAGHAAPTALKVDVNAFSIDDSQEGDGSCAELEPSVESRGKADTYFTTNSEKNEVPASLKSTSPTSRSTRSAVADADDSLALVAAAGTQPQGLLHRSDHSRSRRGSNPIASLLRSIGRLVKKLFLLPFKKRSTGSRRQKREAEVSESLYTKRSRHDMSAFALSRKESVIEGDDEVFAVIAV